MCEILGICGQQPFAANDMLDSFFAHGQICKDGWGLAVFHKDRVTVEKEPTCAVRSQYLRHRLSGEIKARNFIAHLRKATLGRVEYANCHPFVRDDDSGRTWTLVHNGTLFNGTYTSRFLDQQEGSTDSERILLYLISLVNDHIAEYGNPPDEEERCAIMNELAVRLSDGNKLNLLVFDGAVMYVHANCPQTLHIWQDEEKVFFATVPVRFDGWREITLNQLFAYKEGKLIYSGTPHEHVFYDEEHDYTSLFSAFSEL